MNGTIERISRFFIEFPICIFILETLSFVVGWHVTAWPILISFFFLLGYELWKGNTNQERWRFCAGVVLIFAISIILMTFFYDTSYDGQWYHSAVIVLLQQGWNPFSDPIITPEGEPFGTGTSLWISHYPKGMETIESGIVALTGNLESGKALNLLFVLSLAGYSHAFLNHLLPSVKRWKRNVLVSLFVFNPVVVNQTFTHYIDYACYVFIVIGCILVYDVVVLKNNRSIMTLGLLGFFVPTVKMNIVFWFMFWILLFYSGVWMYTKLYNWKLLRSMVVAVMLGFVVGGFNPYVTNICIKGNLLYPLNGSARELVERNSMPEMMWGKDRIYQANYSLLVNPYSNDVKRHGNTHILSISKDDIMDSARHDVQLGGFGIFFFEVLLILLILFLSLKKSTEWYYAGGGILLLYLSLFFLPSGSLARYVPFFYLLPLVIIIKSLLERDLSGGQRILINLSMCLMMLNAIISMTGVSAMVVQQKIQNDYIVKELKGFGKKVYVRSPSCQLYDKMAKAGIEYTLKKPQGKKLIKIDMVGCDPIIDAPASIFRYEDQCLLMKKVSLYQLKISEYKRELSRNNNRH